MGWPLATIGAGTSLVAGVIGSTMKVPEGIDVKFPAADPVEQEMAKLQLNVATELASKVKDPKIMQDIFKMLPEDKMSEEDLARFTQEYSKISEDATLNAMSQAGQGFGKNLQTLVDKGQISQEYADMTKARSEAGITAMTNILKKRLDASRIGMARSQWIRDQSANLGTASAIAKVDQTNKALLNQTIQGALDYTQKRQGAETGVQGKVASANLQNAFQTAGTQDEFKANLFTGELKSGLTAYDTYKKKQQLDEFAKQNPQYANLINLYKAGL